MEEWDQQASVVSWRQQQQTINAWPSTAASSDQPSGWLHRVDNTLVSLCPLGIK